MVRKPADGQKGQRGGAEGLSNPEARQVSRLHRLLAKEPNLTFACMIFLVTSECITATYEE
jgi:hypothetical protein